MTTERDTTLQHWRQLTQGVARVLDDDLPAGHLAAVQLLDGSLYVFGRRDHDKGVAAGGGGEGWLKMPPLPTVHWAQHTNYHVGTPPTGRSGGSGNIN